MAKDKKSSSLKPQQKKLLSKVNERNDKKIREAEERKTKKRARNQNNGD